MEIAELMILKKFYVTLYNTLLLKKRLKKESVFISLFDPTSTDRFRILKESSLNKNIFDQDSFTKLIENNYIRETDVIDEYVITAVGIWIIEKEKNTLNENILINYIDNKYYNCFESNKSLSDKEKILLLGMIGARTFSEQSCIDLKKDDTTLNSWKDILDKTYDRLKSYNQIKSLKKEDLYGKKGNEHPVSNLIRHSFNLSIPTKGVYVVKKPQRYYLDIYLDNNFKKQNLIFLFSLIFECKDNIEFCFIDDMANFLNEIAYDKSIYIFNIKEHAFVNPAYDSIIKDCLKECIFY